MQTQTVPCWSDMTDIEHNGSCARIDRKRYVEHERKYNAHEINAFG